MLEQFLTTVDESGTSDSNKLKYLKSLLNGKTKAAIEGMGFFGQKYQVAWQTLEHDFGRPELVVNAQLRKIHSYPFIKPHDSLEIVRYSQIVSGCVNVLSQFGYESDINSESVMSSAVRKLPRELQNKWMTYVLRGGSINKNMRVFSAWQKEIAQVQDNLRWHLGSSNNKAKPTFNRDKPKTTSYAATSDSGSSTKTQCPLKDGEHKIWQCEKFKKKKIAERHEAVRKCNLCFSCLGFGHRIGQCKANRTCGKDGCSKRHNILQHSDDKKPNNQKESHSKGETANHADAVLTANSCSGSLQIVAITLSSGNISIETMAICDTGSTLSFVDCGQESQGPVRCSRELNHTQHCWHQWNKRVGQREIENQGNNSEGVGVRDVPRSPLNVPWK